MTMKDFPLHNDGNVVPLDTKLKPKADARDNERQAFEKAVPGAKDDPRMQEALRLIGAFLAIEDDVARGALITMAERLVTYDWVRKTQRR